MAVLRLDRDTVKTAVVLGWIAAADETVVLQADSDMVQADDVPR